MVLRKKKIFLENRKMSRGQEILVLELQNFRPGLRNPLILWFSNLCDYKSQVLRRNTDF